MLALMSGFMYWFFYINPETAIESSIKKTTDKQTGFSPFARNNTPSTSSSTEENNAEIVKATSTQPIEITKINLPKLRLLSNAPIGGMFASTKKIKKSNQASTTIEENLVRYIDRGTGHVYEANDINASINQISNTTLPKIYESYWNKNLNTIIVRYLKDNSDSITNFYTEIRPVASSTATSSTPFEIKGKYLSDQIKEIAVSPEGDKIFTWNIENDGGVGYISNFDEKSKVKIAEIPINQVNIDWPEKNTVTVTTKGSGSASGFSYSIDTKSAEMKKIIGGIRGLSVKMSNDGKEVIYSSGNKSVGTYILNLKDNSSSETLFKTLVDKCVWSKIRKNEVYCAVPTEIPDGFYPDDWYKGNISFVDQIWHLDVTTGEVHLLANLLNLSNTLIDATNLTLDPKENFLYFINKRDLSLWSLDLNQ